MLMIGVLFDFVLMGCVLCKEMIVKKKVEILCMVVYFCFKFFLNFVIVRIFWLVLFFFLNYKRKEKFGD